MKDKFGKSLTSEELARKIGNRINTILLELEVYVLHLVGYFPSHHVRRFFYRLSGMKIGSGSTLHVGARFYKPANVTIGEDTIIGEFAVLDGRAKLHIGNHVDIATEVMIYNSQHDINAEDFGAVSGPVVIED